jgi:hypothetical protein
VEARSSREVVPASPSITHLRSAAVACSEDSPFIERKVSVAVMVSWGRAIRPSSSIQTTVGTLITL